MKAKNIPLGEKEYLNPTEAIQHWNLSNRKFRIFLREGNHDFVALYGSRRLIIRTAFEKYLLNNPAMKEELKNGPSKKRL